ncbi:hypothetical protein HGRIS_008432 [Hohenbuehelia grisea]|uniref:Uncharacterized protein n=1 Tax=Hohenbuehelia grisea TaxID=104357 RepID=A0ABR3J9E2_9AGAR
MPSDTDVLRISDLKAVTIMESRTTIERGTTGLRTWLASFTLARYLLSNPNLVNQRRVLELGSGTGFLGSVVASLQLNSPHALSDDTRIWMTDVDENVLTRCRDNFQLPCNASAKHQNTAFRKLDWSHSLNTATCASLQGTLRNEIRADVILGADLVFDPSLIPALVGTLRLGLHNADVFALISLTVRQEATVTAFLDAASSALNVVEVETSCDQGADLFTSATGGTDVNLAVRIFRIMSK